MSTTSSTIPNQHILCISSVLFKCDSNVLKHSALMKYTWLREGQQTHWKNHIANQALHSICLISMLTDAALVMYMCIRATENLVQYSCH